MDFFKKKIDSKTDDTSGESVKVKAKLTRSQLITAIVGIVLAVILLPICIINCVLVIKGVANPDDVPSIFGVTPMVVLSGSMSDTILTGDLIFLKEVEDAGALEVDDVIAFYTGNESEVVTHRIVGVSEVDGVTYYTTKGDYFMNSVDTSAVAETSVIGIYDGSRIGGIGNVIMFMQEPYGMAVVIGIPVLAYVAYEVMRKMQSQKKKAVAEAAENASKATDVAMEELAKLKAELDAIKAQSEATSTNDSGATQAELDDDKEETK